MSLHVPQQSDIPRFCPGGLSPPANARPAFSQAQKEAVIVMSEIESQASAAWGMGSAIAAVDLMTVDIPQHERTSTSLDGLPFVNPERHTEIPGQRLSELETEEEVKREVGG